MLVFQSYFTPRQSARRFSIFPVANYYPNENLSYVGMFGCAKCCVSCFCNGILDARREDKHQQRHDKHSECCDPAHPPRRSCVGNDRSRKYPQDDLHWRTDVDEIFDLVCTRPVYE